MRRKASEKEWKFYKILGKELRKIREKRGLSQKGLAERVGKTHQAIQFVEAGKIKFNVYFLMKMAEALDVSVPVMCMLAKKAYEEALKENENK